MPVPDTFMIAPDFFECPFCLECYPDTECRHGLFKINDYDKQTEDLMRKSLQGFSERNLVSWLKLRRKTK